MSGELVERKGQHPIPALFDQLGIRQVKSSDRFVLTYRDGLIEAHVKRKSGQTETAIKHVKGNGFSQFTVFDPELMSREDRNWLIRSKYRKGETQSDLAKIFGLSQAMISKIVSA